MPCYLLLLLFFLSTCSDRKQKSTIDINNSELEIFSANRATISDLKLPKYFHRPSVKPLSFAAFLRALPLKTKGSKVKYYNGTYKSNDEVYAAVIDLPIGKKDLHQCADAIIRLRAEYFWNQKRYDQIHFNFTNGQNVAYSKWKQGYRIAFDGNQASWIKKAKPSDSYETFWSYLETIFMYAGTASLEKELKPVVFSDLKIGDIFIQGGYPGHAVIVVDLAIEENTGNKIFMLAQSYMPAQELQLLKNPEDPKLSPWYSTEFGQELVTPEWTFNKSNLRRFSE